MRRLGLATKTDVMDGVRSRVLPVTAVLFGLLGGLIGSIITPGEQAGVSIFASVLLGLLLVLGPLIGLYTAYDALVAKRHSGELKVLLGLPFSRGELVLGAAIGRSIVLAVSAISAVVAAVVVSLLTSGLPELPLLGVVLLVGITMSVVYVSLAVGISANTSTTSRAAGLAFLVFLLFVVRVWDLLPAIVNVALNQLSAPTIPQSTIETYLQLTPHAGLRNLVTPAVPELVEGFQPFVGAPPASPVLGLAVVLAWGIGPIAIGYLRFRRADLST